MKSVVRKILSTMTQFHSVTHDKKLQFQKEINFEINVKTNKLISPKAIKHPIRCLV